MQDKWSGKLLVSLTTISHRVDSLHAVLETLLSQTRPPDELHLFLSDHAHLLDAGIRHVPKALTLLANSHRLHIHYVKNTGPYRKLLPLLRRTWDEDVCIVTVDDDTL